MSSVVNEVMEEVGGGGGVAASHTHTLLHPAVLGSQPADLSHAPHSCLSDTSSEVTNTKETQRVSDIRGTSQGRKIHR